MFYGAPTMDLSKKKPPEVASRKRSETVEKQAFSCNGADFKKKPPRQILRLSINQQKPLGKSMILKVWPATVWLIRDGGGLGMGQEHKIN